MRKSDRMKRCKRVDILVLLILLCFLLVPIGRAGVRRIGNFLRERERIEALRMEPGYIAKQSYYVTREKYIIFYMVNESLVDDILDDMVTDQFIADLHAVAGDDGYSQCEIELYLLIPTKEVPYGWTDEKASSEFQDATLLQMAVYRITIPGDADTLDACTVKELTC